jgi:hypothetical protein
VSAAVATSTGSARPSRRSSFDGSKRAGHSCAALTTAAPNVTTASASPAQNGPNPPDQLRPRPSAIVDAPTAAPTRGAVSTAHTRKTAASDRRVRSSRRGRHRLTSVAPTSGSAVFANANPSPTHGLCPCTTLIVNSVSPAASSTQTQRRRSVSSRAARVTPAGGKKTAVEAAWNSSHADAAPAA